MRQQLSDESRRKLHYVLGFLYLQAIGRVAGAAGGDGCPAFTTCRVVSGDG